MKNKLLVKYKEKKQNFGKCYGSKYYLTIYIYIYIYINAGVCLQLIELMTLRNSI